MLAVCCGNAEEGKKKNKHELICDKHKGNTSLTVNPLDKHSVERISYKSDGTIYSDDADIQKDLDETLNLNCDAVLLKQNRKAVLDAVKRNISKKTQNTLSKRQLETCLLKLSRRGMGNVIRSLVLLFGI